MTKLISEPTDGSPPHNTVKIAATVHVEPDRRYQQRSSRLVRFVLLICHSLGCSESDFEKEKWKEAGEEGTSFGLEVLCNEGTALRQKY